MKRAQDGRLYYDLYGPDGKYIILIDRKEPGGLFEKHPIRITERLQPKIRANEYITEESFLHRFNSLNADGEQIYTA